MNELLFHLVDQAADTNPNTAAFVRDKNCITYRQLSSQSNQLANVLVKSGVKCGDRVGVFIGREIESAVAIYGIMKAGGIYVPLDPNAAATVNADVIQDCSLRIIVTHESKEKQIAKLLAVTTEVHCIVGATTDATTGSVSNITAISWQDILGHSNQNLPEVAVSQFDPAYILYTSGTTGKPKGIVHTHHSGLSYAKLTVAEYGLQSSDRIGCHPPLHFDMSTFGFLAGPMACATTVIVSEADTKFPASISAFIQDEKISVWYSVPIVLSQLLSHGVLNNRSVNSLRWVVYAGESFPAKDLQKLRSIWPDVSFSNAYGPTETNVCTVFNIPSLNTARETQTQQIGDSVPIGKPWGAAQAIVVANDMTAVARGESGELLICSPTGMKGYWQRPEQTADVFVQSVQTGITYYKTGDLVHQDENGNFNFEGRIDRQVKIRGFRIELEGTELVINSHPDVDESCVKVSSNDDGIESLTAYVVTRLNCNLHKHELLQYLKNRLPAHSVPSTIKFTTQFSRTSTGKLDRTQLEHSLNQ